MVPGPSLYLAIYGLANTHITTTTTRASFVISPSLSQKKICHHHPKDLAFDQSGKMVLEESLVYDVKLSSVGPGQATGSDVFHNPGGLDLAMKLHYLRVVYFFESEAAQDLTIMKIKDAMFTWFNRYFITCGRFRRSDSGRPFIKCNDCGARFIEGKCTKTLDEWLANKDWSLYKLLASHQVIGPELSFSPPVLLQVLASFPYTHTIILYLIVFIQSFYSYKFSFFHFKYINYSSLLSSQVQMKNYLYIFFKFRLVNEGKERGKKDRLENKTELRL